MGSLIFHQKSSPRKLLVTEMTLMFLWLWSRYTWYCAWKMSKRISFLFQEQNHRVHPMNAQFNLHTCAVLSESSDSLYTLVICRLVAAVSMANEEFEDRFSRNMAHTKISPRLQSLSKDSKWNWCWVRTMLCSQCVAKQHMGCIMTKTCFITSQQNLRCSLITVFALHKWLLYS